VKEYILTFGRFMMLDLRIPSTFPCFDDWPVEKIAFLVKRAESEEIIEEDHIDYDSDEGRKSLVVCTSRIQENNPMSTCKYCDMTMKLVFNHDHEEWVYEGCKKMNNGICLHSLCYYFSRRQRLRYNN